MRIVRQQMNSVFLRLLALLFS